MSIDPQTNMPELPEGYFWRVVHDEYDHYMHVRLMREPRKHTNSRFLRYWFEAYTAQTVDYLGFDVEELDHLNDEIVKNIIMKCAIRLKERYDKDLRLKAAQSMLESYAGDYPPKKLD